MTCACQGRFFHINLPRDFLSALQQEKPDGWGVEVVMLEDSANPVSKGSELRRYNVNGVELDAAAFAHLKQEVAMKTVPAEKVGGYRGDCYHLGRFPDKSGGSSPDRVGSLA